MEKPQQSRKALWIRLDIPYAQDAVFMRGVLAYNTSEQYPSTIETSKCPDIPTALDKLIKMARENQITIDSSVTLVIPLDNRHNLAWIVKEQADKNQWNFSRHIPENQDLAIDAPTEYENFETGSDEEKLDLKAAHQKILNLNNLSRSIFNSGDLIAAIEHLRHALWLCLKHFDWFAPNTAYTLRNLAYTLTSTGNQENIHEIRLLLLKMTYNWQLSPLPKDKWDQSNYNILKDLADICVQMGGAELSIFFMDFYQNIKA